MQNNNNNRKILNSKKDALPAAEVQNNAINYRNKKSATSIKKCNSNNKSHTTNINNHNNNSNSNNKNTNAINSTNNSCNNAKTTAANHFHTKIYKPNGYKKQIATPTTADAAATSPSTIAETTITAPPSVIPQNCGSQEAMENDLVIVKTKSTTGTLGGGGGPGGVNVKSKAILSDTLSSNQIDTISSSSSQQQQQKQSQQHPSSSHKKRHHSINSNSTGSTVSNDKGIVAGIGATMSFTNKTKKTLIAPTVSETKSITTTPTTTTALAIIQKQSTALTVLPSTAATTAIATTTTATLTKTKATSTSTSLSIASNGNASKTNTNSNGGTGGGGGIGNSVSNITNNSNKNFQIPSDILDDLASRFVINVPDMELSNLIRICFQIELAHWFYLDFFCTGTDEEKALLKPVGMKYFATQLFQHIPFLSQHLPKIDTVLEDWKNYKLAVPTFGAILISEDLQYCLLVQSYFAKSSWGFPKGKVNETEDPEHCATREVFEETGYDITGLIVPKDYIEAVINDQYTRLYIVCNVSLDTVFEPRTRNEIRCCVWFAIDSLPNNKNDAISKAKLGQNANSFFMILPFVKRLKKWVNEKRAKAGIIVINNGGATATAGAGAGIGLATCGNTNNGNNNINNNKSSDRRKYSSNICLNNATTVSGAILKSPSLGYVGENHFNSGKKNRQQQQQQQKIALNNNTNNNNNKSNNVAGCFELNKIETTTFVAVGADDAVAASAAANARSKRQRHKSMGDLDNMNALNNSNNNGNKNTNSCNKTFYNNKRNSVQKMSGNVSGNDNHHKNDNAIHNNGGSSRRQLFHSQSQNDGVFSKIGVDSDQIITSSFNYTRQDRQQQRATDNLKYVQQKQNPDMIQHFTEAVSISDEETRKHIRQRAKSQSDKATNNNNNNNNQQQQQQQFQRQTINNDCYFSNNNSNNNKNNTTTTISRLNLQRQSPLIHTNSTILRTTTTTATTTSNIVNTAENVVKVDDNADVGDVNKNNDNNKNVGTIDKTGAASGGGGGEIIVYGEQKLPGQQRYRRYTTATAPTMTGNDLFAWSAAYAQHNTAPTNTTNNAKIIKSVFEASAIETRLIEEQKFIRQLEGAKPQQQTQEIIPYMLPVPKQQQQQQHQQQKAEHQQLFSSSQQQNQHQHQQHQHHPLQHSASSPGLATWKNFSFTKNLISNVFL